MPAGRKPTGINGRNGGRANDGGLDVGKPAEQHAGRTRWVHPIRGVERKAGRIADMKNPPRCSPGGATIQHSNFGNSSSDTVRVQPAEATSRRAGYRGWGSGHQKPASVGPGGRRTRLDTTANMRGVAGQSNGRPLTPIEGRGRAVFPGLTVAPGSLAKNSTARPGGGTSSAGLMIVRKQLQK